MSTIGHKGFRIVARPYQLHDTKLWTVEVEIRRKGRQRAFSGEARYSTEEEATAQSLDLGCRIVDGQMPGYSIESLR